MTSIDFYKPCDDIVVLINTVKWGFLIKIFGNYPLPAKNREFIKKTKLPY